MFNHIKNIVKRIIAFLKSGISFLMVFQKEIRTKEGKTRLRKNLNKISYYSKFVLRETFSYDIEKKAGKSLKAIEDAQAAVAANDADLLEAALTKLRNALASMYEVLGRMPERCDPYIY